MNPMGLILIAAGLFSIIGAVLDWDFFMNHRKAQFLVSIIGRNGARIFYVILGVIISVIGTLFAFGVLKNAN